MQYQILAHIKDFTHKQFKLFQLSGKKVGIFKKKDGSFFAMESQCKHQNANLFHNTQRLPDNLKIRCPWHGWEYDLNTGDCLQHSWAKLKSFPLKISPNGEILVCLDHEEPDPLDEDISPVFKS